MNIYDRTVKFIHDRRRTETDYALAEREKLINENERLYAAYAAYRAEMIKSAKGEKNSLEKTRKIFSELYVECGGKPEPEPHCPICGDGGFADGKYCKCVVRLAINSDKANLSLPAVDFEKATRSAPDCIKKSYESAKKYISSADKPFFMLFGDAGTGKTVLASAIATELMKLGASAVTVSAFDFVRRALDFHTQFSVEDYVDRFTPMLDCDVLVIDDLGKETVLKNVTKEYLYAVINERWLHKKRTVVTSNLKPEEALTRYGESIASRLFDKSLSYNIKVVGKNARLSD